MSYCEDLFGCSTSSCQHGCGNYCKGACRLINSGYCWCDGFCIKGCWNGCAHTCKADCANDCTGTCSSSCGRNCNNNCSGGCKGDCNTGCTSCSGCTGSCTNSCAEGCNNNCSGGCKTGCKTGCKNTCKDTCKGCTGSCDTKCNATCSNSSQVNNYNAVIGMSDIIKAAEANTFRTFLNNEVSRRGKTVDTIATLSVNQTANAAWWNAVIKNLNRVLESSDDRASVTAGSTVISKAERDAVIALAIALYKAIVPVD